MTYEEEESARDHLYRAAELSERYATAGPEDVEVISDTMRAELAVAAIDALIGIGYAILASRTTN